MIQFYLNRLKENKLAVAGLALIFVLAMLAVVAPFLSPFDPAGQHLVERLRPPAHGFWLGTDDLGRDVLSRMLYGIRISLTVGFVAVGIMVVIGTVLGLISGYFGGWVDTTKSLCG
jgi:peptide/nickel transport system permease protein